MVAVAVAVAAAAVTAAATAVTRKKLDGVVGTGLYFLA